MLIQMVRAYIANPLLIYTYLDDNKLVTMLTHMTHWLGSSQYSIGSK